MGAQVQKYLNVYSTKAIALLPLLLVPSQDNFKVWGQIGAGIVADSDPEREWYESLNKAEAPLTALRLTV